MVEMLVTMNLSALNFINYFRYVDVYVHDYII